MEEIKNRLLNCQIDFDGHKYVSVRNINIAIKYINERIEYLQNEKFGLPKDIIQEIDFHIRSLKSLKSILEKDNNDVI